MGPGFGFKRRFLRWALLDDSKQNKERVGKYNKQVKNKKIAWDFWQDNKEDPSKKSKRGRSLGLCELWVHEARTAGVPLSPGRRVGVQTRFSCQIYMKPKNIMLSENVGARFSGSMAKNAAGTFKAIQKQVS